MNPEMQAILSRIDQLAEKLGTTANNIWNLYVYQMYIEVYMHIGLTSLLLSGSIILHKLMNKTSGPYFDNCGDLTPKGLLAIICTLTYIVSFVFIMITIFQLGKLLNPEYYAFAKILEQIR